MKKPTKPKTTTSVRYTTFWYLLAVALTTSVMAPQVARANFFDKLKQAAEAIKDIKNAVGNKPAAKQADSTSQQNAAAPQKTANQPATQQPTAQQQQLTASSSATPPSTAATPATPSATPETAAVTQTVVGPLMSGGNSYSVSLNGAHLATVNMRGSRFVVTKDGVDDPHVNAILLSQSGYSGPFAEQGGVALSDDGNHYAYVARIGRQIEIIKDGKELLKFPENGIGSPLYLIFSPHGGKHFFFVSAGQYRNQSNVWVDGKQAMIMDTNNGGRIEFSADGEHYVYIGIPQPTAPKRVLIVDGNESSYNVDGIKLRARFTADGKHVICVTEPGGYLTIDFHVLFDGKPVINVHGKVVSIVPAPQGDAWAAVVSSFKDYRYRVYLNGKEVPAASYSSTSTASDPAVKFSPDGRHLAVACNSGDGNSCVVRDGKRGDPYDRIESSSMQFSADSQSMGYFAVAGQKLFGIVDGNEMDTAFRSTCYLYFSPEGHHSAVVGEADNGSGTIVYVDGKAVARKLGMDSSTFIFSPDGSHWAVIDGGKLVLDGRTLPFSGIQSLRYGGYYQFSPDGSTLAVVNVARARSGGLFLINLSLNKILRLGPAGAASVIFSPDGKHIFWESNKTVPGMRRQQAFICVDGQVTAAHSDCNVFPSFQLAAQKAACWTVGTDDKLRGLRAVNNNVELFTVTPPAGGIAALWK